MRPAEAALYRWVGTLPALASIDLPATVADFPSYEQTPQPTSNYASAASNDTSRRVYLLSARQITRHRCRHTVRNRWTYMSLWPAVRYRGNSISMGEPAPAPCTTISPDAASNQIPTQAGVFAGKSDRLLGKRSKCSREQRQRHQAV